MEARISGAIIALNEEDNLERCILSMQSVCDEIVVVDSGSTDRTQQIVQDLGARLIVQPFLGHIQQKNFAVDQTQYDVVLSLDADEALSDELRQSIARIKNDFTADGYRFKRLNNYCGQWIKYGTWYPDRKIRLWQKGKGEWGGENPHDRIVMKEGASVGFLPGNLLHYTATSPGEYDRQIEKFSAIQAKALHQRGVRPGFFHFYIKPLVRFITSYLLRLGFLDGKAGWQVARSQYRLVSLRYQKLQSINDMLNFSGEGGSEAG